MKDGKQMGPEPSSDQIVPDSREKLEEEVCSFFASNRLMRDSAMEAFVTGIVYGWLDRQEAITERECIDQHIADQIGSIWKDEKVRKLQAKLDDFDGDCYCGATVTEWYDLATRMQDEVDELTEERDELRARLDELDRLRMEPPVEAALDAGAGKDSREKLESDARNWIDKRRHHPLGGVGLVQKLQGWLDRQAEITEREITSTGVADWCASCSLRDGLYLAMDAKEGLRKSLDETIAERNALVHCLEADHGLKASWDGLRGLWNIEVTNEHMDARDALAVELADIEQTHMRLPVDADGVPIHVGDELETAHGSRGIVEYVGECEVRVYRGGEHFRISQDEYAYTCRHVKPHTVEDILALFLTAVGDDDPHHYDEQIAEYAERIRKAVER